MKLKSMPKEDVSITQKCHCPLKEIGRGMKIKLKALIILIKKQNTGDLATCINLFPFPTPQANDSKVSF